MIAPWQHEDSNYRQVKISPDIDLNQVDERHGTAGSFFICLLLPNTGNVCFVFLTQYKKLSMLLTHFCGIKEEYAGGMIKILLKHKNIDVNKECHLGTPLTVACVTCESRADEFCLCSMFFIIFYILNHE